MLLEDSQLHLSLDSDQIPAPLECFRRYLIDLKADRNIQEKSSPMNRAIDSSLRDMYHYARVSGSHVLECVMSAALSSVKKEKLQEVNDVGGAEETTNSLTHYLTAVLLIDYCPIQISSVLILASEGLFCLYVIGSYFVSPTSPTSSFHGLGSVAWQNCSP